MNFLGRSKTGAPDAKAQARPVPPPQPEPAQAPEGPPAASGAGTLYALVGTAFTAATLHGSEPSYIARYAAVCMAVSLGISVVFDLRRGLRNLQRADLFAILAFYFLTLFEFLFPQPRLDEMLYPETVVDGVRVCLVGFAGLLIGRHLWRPKRQPFHATLTHEIPAGWLIAIFWMCVGVGYLNMMMAVNFDVREMIRYFMAPRFSQPWSREKFGDWKALLYELTMFIQLIPPLAGIMLARAHRYPRWHLLLMVAALGLTFFYGFTSGTRNVFAGFLVTFLIGYSLAVPPHRTKEVVYLGAVFAVLMCVATFFMLRFRDVGLKNYLGAAHVPPPESAETRTLYVDYNLFTICKLAEVFPRTHPFLGWEIPYQALIRPIPRAIWEGKPQGLSMTIEDVMEVEGLTISASFAGEAYMAGGIVAVFVIGMALGTFTGWWSSLGSPRNSEFGHLVYASGFVAAVISMRSLFVFTTALIPTVFAIVGGGLVVRMLLAQTRRLLAKTHRPMQQAPMRKNPKLETRNPKQPAERRWKN